MLERVKGTDLFYQYYAQWITVYKDGAIRKVEKLHFTYSSPADVIPICTEVPKSQIST